MAFKILIATTPFGKNNFLPFQKLIDSGLEIISTNNQRKYERQELIELISDVDGIIAGTEKYDQEILEKAKKLKIIARVGIGLDNIDFEYTSKHNIAVTYTPDAPTKSVAELTLSLIISLIRYLPLSMAEIKAGEWNRHIGKTINASKIGIIGTGRVGKLLVKYLKPFSPKIYAHDIEPDLEFAKNYNLSYVSKEELLSSSDVMTIHIPYYDKTINYISAKEFQFMNKGSFIINTSRGGIIDEVDLYKYLSNGHLGGAALDVFSKEPYYLNHQNEFQLTTLKNVILTAHMGSCTEEGRLAMEIGAAESIIHFFKENKIIGSATEDMLKYYKKDLEN